MGRIRKRLAGLVPVYGIFPLIMAVTVNTAVYSGSRMIAGEWHHYNIESPLDRLVPFWPPSVLIYLGCYLFWVVNYVLIARQGKKEACQFFAADFLSRMVCLVFFLAFPTTNIRPEPAQEGFWNWLMGFVYSVDAADNLFPSIHCLVSWFCYIGIRGKKEIPAWYQGASCVMAVLVCISTLTTKQHVLVDVFGGVVLAELCFRIGKREYVWRKYEKFLDKVNGKIFHKEEQDAG